MAVCNDFIHCECASIVEEMEWEQDELMKARDELLEENAKLNAALNCFFIVDPDKPSAWEYTREQAEAMARAALEPIEKLKGGG